MNIMIAGASGGIGHYLSEQFDVEGNHLYLTYNRSKDALAPIRKAEVTILHGNFTKAAEVENCFSQVPSLDVLINAMGHVENNMIHRMDEGEWDRVIDSNLKTIFLSCKYGVSKMAENGHIINISSILGVMGMIGATNYVAAKGAVEAFTKSFAQECLVKRRVFVNAIALGYFKTGMGLHLTEKIVQMISEKIPLKEFGEPEEILRAVQYIMSSRYLVGQVLQINGGLRI